MFTHTQDLSSEDDSSDIEAFEEMKMKESGFNSLGVHLCRGRGGCDAHGGFGGP